MRNHVRVSCVVLGVTAILAASHVVAQPRKLTSAETERIGELVSAMTLEEKLGQLTLVSGGFWDPTTNKRWSREDIANAIRSGRLGSIYSLHEPDDINACQKVAVEESRLKIPMLFGNDIIHGYKTTFPTPLAEACSWDLALIEKSAQIAAAEARAGGTRWTFAPMVDICRDPRWGRIIEGAGEDPYLGGMIAAARVRGFQGDDPGAPARLLACAKHYVAYGGAEGGRDYNTVDVSERTLREVYLPPFKAAVEAGVGTVMSAFNEIGGVPASANRLTLTTILRGDFGFKGMVVSDYDSIGQVCAHGIAGSRAEAGRLALLAGVDMDMCSLAFAALGDEVASGRVGQPFIDEAVHRVLRAKTWAGVFDKPFVENGVDPEGPPPAENLEAARVMAQHSIVLLKNEGGVLPLVAGARKIAVIGPLADDRKNPFGAWASIGDRAEAVSVLDGVRSKVKESAQILHAAGCKIEDADRSGFEAAVDAARQSDVALVVLGEEADMSGEAHSRASIELPGVQQELLKAIHATGKPTVLLLLTGRPLSIPWAAEHLPAIVLAWHLGNESGNAIADVLFGDFNPCGRLAVSIPHNVGQIPVYYGTKNTGRPYDPNDGYTMRYLDAPVTPLYPFGFGLSYTTFEYANLAVDAKDAETSRRVAVSVDVRNTGERAGCEVVQLYVRDLVASVTRPVRELKGFEKIRLEPGESRRVSFSLDLRQLGFYNLQMRYVVEPGEFQVWVGPDATRGLDARFEVAK